MRSTRPQIPIARAEVQLGNDLADLDRLAVFVESFGRGLAWEEADTFAFTLCLEEVVANVIHHGSLPGEARAIRVELVAEADVATARVSDDAGPYNPLERPEVDTAAPLEDRAVGGLGIHLLRRMMDSVEYAYREGGNHLTLRRLLRRSEREREQGRFSVDHAPRPDGSTVVRLRGRIDSQSAPLLGIFLEDLRRHGHQRILLDFSSVDYLGSPGLTAVLASAKALKAAGGAIALCGLQGNVQHVFEVTGLTHVLATMPASGVLDWDAPPV